jgi:nucleoid-associated protein YgaU
MGSLTAHLLETGDHGRLRFHPSCPVCRQERLFGTLSSEPVVSRRAQALLAGGVLALSTSAPTVVVAAEPDRQLEGVAAPQDPGGPELDDPGFDPGGDTALPFETAPAPAAPGGAEDSGDGAPIDVEPSVDLDARLAPLADTGVPVVDEPAAIPPSDAVPPVDPGPTDGSAPLGEEVPTGGLETPGAPPNRNAATVAPAPPMDGRTRPGEHLVGPPRTFGPTRARYKHEDERSDVGAPASTERVNVGAGAPSEPEVAPVSAAPSPAAVAQADVSTPVTPERPPFDPRARFYVVQPGDSLWSIAKRLLGRDASAGRIAREVNRLWSLNSSRIATGDPDLLMVGTRLELR